MTHRRRSEGPLTRNLRSDREGQELAAYRPSDERRNATQSSRAKRNAGIFYSLDQVDRRAAKRRGENAMIAPRWRRVRLETQVTHRLLTPDCSSRRISPQTPNARPVGYTGLMHRLKPMCSVKG